MWHTGNGELQRWERQANESQKEESIQRLGFSNGEHGNENLNGPKGFGPQVAFGQLKPMPKGGAQSNVELKDTELGPVDPIVTNLVRSVRLQETCDIDEPGHIHLVESQRHGTSNTVKGGLASERALRLGGFQPETIKARENQIFKQAEAREIDSLSDESSVGNGLMEEEGEEAKSKLRKVYEWRRRKEKAKQLIAEAKPQEKRGGRWRNWQR